MRCSTSTRPFCHDLLAPVCGDHRPSPAARVDRVAALWCIVYPRDNNRSTYHYHDKATATLASRPPAVLATPLGRKPSVPAQAANFPRLKASSTRRKPGARPGNQKTPARPQRRCRLASSPVTVVTIHRESSGRPVELARLVKRAVAVALRFTLRMMSGLNAVPHATCTLCRGEDGWMCTGPGGREAWPCCPCWPCWPSSGPWP